jgi:hypothetical protein
MTKLGKLLATVIDSGTINRAEYPIGHIGRTRDLEKVSAREAGEGLAVHSSQFTVHNSRFAVGGLRLGVGCSSFMADQSSRSNGPYGTNRTNGNHMTSLLNRKTRDLKLVTERLTANGEPLLRYRRIAGSELFVGVFVGDHGFDRGENRLGAINTAEEDGIFDAAAKKKRRALVPG